MNVFSGGKRPSAEHLALRIDEVALSTSGRIGCPDAFDDDEEDPNEAAINKLADLGVLQGCGEFLVCPSDAVSRRTFLDLVEAAGGTLSAESAGAFKDVTSGSDQPVAAAVDAGLLDVCGGELVCPESPITRAESARVVASAFGLPAGTPDAAFDDVEDATTSAAAAALRSARITGGCGTDRFCPEAHVTRAQAAGLIANAIGQTRVPAPATGRLARPIPEDVTREASSRTIAHPPPHLRS
jgi:hypothetical protein